MNRVIITTCGTSLLETSCWELLSPNANYVLHPYKDDLVEKRLRQQLCRSEIMEIINDGDGPERLGKTFMPDSWDVKKLADLPAELASLRALVEVLKKKEPTVTLGKGDKIVLLHSANDEGKFCAETIEYVLINKLNNILKGVDIEPEEKKGLDPKDAAKMAETLKEIWDSYKKEITGKSNTTKYIFNLTGGYKATAMVLAGLSSLLSSTLQVPVVYLHEDSSFDNLFAMRWEMGLIKLDSLDFNSSKLNNPVIYLL